MGATSWIISHINRLPKNQIFTTRELLSYGSRTAIDKALGRMVKSERIVRLCRGVFIRELGSKKPTALEVARAKAHAFGKRIAIYGASIAKELGLVDLCPTEPVYLVDGRSSSFRYGIIRIHLRGACARKVRLSDSKAARVIKALWYLGKDRCGRQVVHKARQGFYLQPELQEFDTSKAWMPEWLGRYFPREYSLDMSQNNRWISMLCSETTSGYGILKELCRQP